MESSDLEETFGARFLKALRQQLGASVFDYAAAQRIKAMDRDAVARVLREHGRADYATIQLAKQCHDPVELARLLAERARAAQNQAAQAAILFSLFG